MKYDDLDKLEANSDVENLFITEEDAKKKKLRKNISSSKTKTEQTKQEDPKLKMLKK
jgi:hypothetical protein